MNALRPCLLVLGAALAGCTIPAASRRVLAPAIVVTAPAPVPPVQAERLIPMPGQLQPSARCGRRPSGDPGAGGEACQRQSLQTPDSNGFHQRHDGL